jgi:pimeloyl-ACP methyl ester carboxylesterase
VSPHDGRSVSASDGRTLTVAEWGDADGFPVFWLHGSPDSRFSRHYDESEYSRAGARVITYDRPGYGASDRDPERRVVSCVGDVAAIADALGIKRFAVTGGSGGGPHARAVAARLPDRVTRAACSVSPAPHDIPDFDWSDGMDPENIRLTEVALQGGPAHVAELERLAAEILKRVAADPAKVLGDDWALSESDRAELDRPERHDMTREAINEAFRNGVWGLVDDDLAFLSPSGFDVSEIRVPTRTGLSTATVMSSSPSGTVNGSRRTCRARKSSSCRMSVTLDTRISSPSASGGSSSLCDLGSGASRIRIGDLVGATAANDGCQTSDRALWRRRQSSTGARMPADSYSASIVRAWPRASARPSRSGASPFAAAEMFSSSSLYGSSGLTGISSPLR